MSENLIIHIELAVSVCRTDLIALDRLLDLFSRQFLCFPYISLCFS